MKILVTGGAGFIGSEFVRMALRNELPGVQDPSVVVLDALTYAGDDRNLAEVSELPNYRFVRGDIRDSRLVN